MKVDREIIIAYILGDLDPARHKEVAGLIQGDENWKKEYENWSEVLGQLNAQKPMLNRFEDIPDRYWASFLPRVRERIDERARRFERVRERLFHAAPSFALAAIILFFANDILITNKKLDYLLEQYSWVSNINSTEVVDEYIRENISAADDLISDLLESDDEAAALADWESSYSPTEPLPYDLELTGEEQKELLNKLENTTSF